MKLIFWSFYLISIWVNMNQTAFDFGKDKDGQNWNIINDGVMGGLSKGTLQFTDNTLQFSGKVSLENNGGFTSLRSPFQQFNLSGVKMVEVRYKSTGQAIALSLENSKVFYRPNYKVNLENTKGEWQSVQFTMDQFKEYILGRPTNRRISKDYLEAIIRIGFITIEKREGDFQIEIDYLRFR